MTRNCRLHCTIAASLGSHMNVANQSGDQELYMEQIQKLLTKGRVKTEKKHVGIKRVTQLGSRGQQGVPSNRNHDSENELDLDSLVHDISDNNNFKVLSNKSIILVVAYMRPGSTLTGSLRQVPSGSFYVFEPLHNLMTTFQPAVKSKQRDVAVPYLTGNR